MTDLDGQVIESAAEIYDRFFVPALFAQWAPRMADAVQIEPGQTALDVACGTGVLARELARRVGVHSVSAVDRNPGMLAVARATEPRIDWTQGMAEELPFDDGRFDAVVSQFGLMFYEDRTKALREMWRVASSGGRVAVAVWAGLDANPGYAAVVALLRRLFGDSIASELCAPFCLGDIDALGSLLDRSGIAPVRIETVVGSARFPSIAAWMHTEIRGWTLADRINDAQYELLAREAELALREFVTADGVRFAAAAHIAVAGRGRSS